MSNQPYHNEGFGVAFSVIIIFTIILPAMLILSMDDGWDIFVQMHLPDGDCWENSKHERVCKDDNQCKFGRNFCIDEVYRWRVK